MDTLTTIDTSADEAADTTVADQQVETGDTSIQDQLYPDEGRDDTQDAEGGDQTDEAEQDPNVNDELPKIDPPKSWPDEDKEVFKALLALGPDAVKAAEVIAKRETERDAFVANKGREVAQVRQTVETEARTAIQQVYEASAQQLERYAQMLLPAVPDKRLLYTGNPQDSLLYNQLQVEYQEAVSQHHAMQSQAQQARQQASQIAEYQRNLALQAVAAEMADKLGTEWTEPSERQKLQETLYPIGKELGYSDEAMADANASDLLALKAAHTWKVKADKYDAIQKTKMEPVRAAKQSTRQTQPGAAGGNRGNSAPSVQSVLYPNDPPRR